MARQFDVDVFLARPLTARLATAGPAVRPVWYLWEEAQFWVLVGPWNRIPAAVAADPAVAPSSSTRATCTPAHASRWSPGGVGELLPYDAGRGRRMLTRYLGPDEAAWDARFRSYLDEQHEARWLRITPRALTALDLSFAPSLLGDAGAGGG